MKPVDQLLQELGTAISQANREEERLVAELIRALRHNMAARNDFLQKFSHVAGRMPSNTPIDPSVSDAERRVQEDFERMKIFPN